MIDDHLVIISNAEQSEVEGTRRVLCGLERQMEDLALRFERATFYSPEVDRPLDGYEFDPHVEVRPLSSGIHASNQELARFAPRYVRGIRRAIRDNKGALFLAYVPDSYIGLLALLELRRARVRAFYRVTNDVVAEFLSRRSGGAARVFAATAGRAYDHLLTRLLAGQVAFFTGELRWGQSPRFHQVTSTSLRIADVRPLRVDRPLGKVYFVGRFDEMKGLRYLLDAIPLGPPDVRYHIVGYGSPEQEHEARERVRSLGVEDRVEFHGLVPFGPRLLAHLDEADALVVPSVQEYQGKVPLEAMAAGACVVASRIGGLPRIVRNDENGLLVPPNSPAAIAAALSRLRDDPALRTRLREAGRLVASEATVDVMNGFIVRKLVEHGLVREAKA